MGAQGKKNGEGIRLFESVGTTVESGRGFEFESALLQSSPWVGVKKSIVEHKVSLMQQG